MYKIFTIIFDVLTLILLVVFFTGRVPLGVEGIVLVSVLRIYIVLVCMIVKFIRYIWRKYFKKKEK